MSYTIKGEVEIQRGLGLPTHTTASRTSYTPPRKGYKVFDTDLNTEFTWSGTEWTAAGGDSSGKVDKAGDTMTGGLVFNSSSGGSARDYRIQGVDNNKLYIGTDAETGFHSFISLGTSKMQHQVGNTGSQVLLSIESAGSTSTKYYLNDARGDSVFRYEAGVGGDIEDKFIYNVKVRSLATVLSDASTTLVTKGYMESVIPDTSGFVDLTSAQDIGGIKTFTSDVNVEGTLSTDTLSSDAVSFIETENPLRYTASAVSAIVNDNELINKGYVDDGFVTLTTSQDISGSKTFTSNIKIENNTSAASIVLDTTGATGNSQLIFQDASVQTGFIQNTDTHMYFLREATIDNTFSIYDDYSEFNKNVRAPDPQVDADLTTKSYVDAQVASVSGTPAGDVTFSGNIAVVNSSEVASLTLDTTAAADESEIIFKDDGAITGSITSSATELTITNNTAAPGTITMSNSDIVFNKAVIQTASQSNASNALTRKDFIEANYIPKVGGVATGNFTITGTANVGALTSSSTQIFTSKLLQYSPSILASLTHDNHLVHKAYVDDALENVSVDTSNLVTIDGDQDITGEKTFQDGIIMENGFSVPSKLTFVGSDATEYASFTNNIPEMDEFFLPIPAPFDIESFYALRLFADGQDGTSPASITLDKSTGMDFFNGYYQYLSTDNYRVHIGNTADSSNYVLTLPLFGSSTAKFGDDINFIKLGGTNQCHLSSAASMLFEVMPGGNDRAYVEITDTEFNFIATSGDPAVEEGSIKFDVGGSNGSFVVTVGSHELIAYNGVNNTDNGVIIRGPVYSTEPTIDQDDSTVLTTKGWVLSKISDATSSPAPSQPDYQLATGTGSATYALSFTPATATAGKANMQVFVNGIKQIEGSSKSYTISGNNVTFTTGSIPSSGDDVEFYGFG